MKTFIKIIIITWMMLNVNTSYSKITMPKIFSDGMVMQCNTNAKLWGTARKSAVIKVKGSWSSHVYITKSDIDGRWKLSVNTPDAGGPYTLTVSDGQPISIKDIMMGEVWICSGQSNMEMPMKGFYNQPVDNAPVDILHSTDPALRVFSVTTNSQLEPVDTLNGCWRKACPENTCNFSATAYYFGRELREMLHVPVGLVVTCWGGSSCEAWMSSEWLKAFPEVKIPTLADLHKQTPNLRPTALYNAMIHPLLGYAIRGVIWYQGEANVIRYQNYANLMSTMIKGWRTQWGEGNFPFYYCQIAPYLYSSSVWKHSMPLLREQQSLVEQNVSNTGMAVLIDAGFRYGIHPRKKIVAGQRLAFLALEKTYGIKGITSESAYFKEAKFKNDTVIVSFARSRMGITGKKGFKSDLFEVAGNDHQFHPAQTWISHNCIYAKSDSVSKPVAVRYAFHDDVEGDLYSDGLPVSPFRSDNW